MLGPPIAFLIACAIAFALALTLGLAAAFFAAAVVRIKRLLAFQDALPLTSSPARKRRPSTATICPLLTDARPLQSVGAESPNPHDQPDGNARLIERPRRGRFRRDGLGRLWPNQEHCENPSTVKTLSPTAIKRPCMAVALIKIFHVRGLPHRNARPWPVFLRARPRARGRSPMSQDDSWAPGRAPFRLRLTNHPAIAQLQVVSLAFDPIGESRLDGDPGGFGASLAGSAANTAWLLRSCPERRSSAAKASEPRSSTCCCEPGSHRSAKRIQVPWVHRHAAHIEQCLDPLGGAEQARRGVIRHPMARDRARRSGNGDFGGYAGGPIVPPQARPEHSGADRDGNERSQSPSHSGPS